MKNILTFALKNSEVQNYIPDYKNTTRIQTESDIEMSVNKYQR